MNVVIVDDDPLVVKSLSLMLSKEEDINVSGTADNGRQAVKLCEQLSPDIVLMDIRMPDVDGIQATRLIKKSFPGIRIVMLTTFQDKSSIHMALKAGAEGYLLKTDKISEIADKLRLLYSGTAVLDGEVLKVLTTPNIPSTDHLTPREKDILDLVAEGMTNKEIAAHLFLSEGTVRNILSVIMDKLNVKNRTQLASLMNEN